jgi:hypothetical protein
MKIITKTGKKNIIVALLGMCVVASSYNTAYAVLPKDMTSASTVAQGNHAPPADPTLKTVTPLHAAPTEPTPVSPVSHTAAFAPVTHAQTNHAPPADPVSTPVSSFGYGYYGYGYGYYSYGYYGYSGAGHVTQTDPASTPVSTF